MSVLLAIAAALGFALSTVGQQRAAARTSDDDARGGTFVKNLLTDRLWLLATGATTIAYGLQAVALGLGSVLIVQPILVTALLFALPLSARLAHTRLSPSALLSGVVLVIALAVFVTMVDPSRGVTTGSSHDWVVVVLVGVPVAVACLVAANMRTGRTRAALLAIVVGLLAGVQSVLTKAVADAFAGGVGEVLTRPETYGLIVVGGAGVYLQQLAFQAGALQASLPIMTVLEPMIAALLGLTLLHEHVRADGGRLTLLIAVSVLLIVSTVVLARAQASVRPTG